MFNNSLNNANLISINGLRVRSTTTKNYEKEYQFDILLNSLGMKYYKNDKNKIKNKNKSNMIKLLYSNCQEKYLNILGKSFVNNNNKKIRLIIIINNIN